MIVNKLSEKFDHFYKPTVLIKTLDFVNKVLESNCDEESKL